MQQLASHSLILLITLGGAACSSDGVGPDAAVDSATSRDTGMAADAADLSDGAVDAAPDSAAPVDSGALADGSSADAGACLAEGIYGPCSTNPGCNCLRGAAVYQFCTASCVEDSECGDPAALGGGTPGCFPINPGAADKICALICTSEADCPCGMTCTFSGVSGVNICAELQ